MGISINDLTSWITSSGLVNQNNDENKGGVHSFFDEKKQNYGFLYPEITGYYINTQKFLFEISNDNQLIKNAEMSANWLIDIHKKFGGIIQGINTDTSRGNHIYTFDTAICSNAFLDSYEMTQNEKYLEFAKLLSDWLVDEALESDGTLKPYKNLDTNNFEESTSVWYKQKGCLHIKTAIPLLRLYSITKNESYLENSLSICNTFKNYQQNDGSIVLHPNQKLIHLHSLCYALEGLLHCYHVTKDKKYLSSCTDSLNWCLTKLENDEIINLWYYSSYQNAKTSYHIAQLIRLMILVDLANNTNKFNNSIEKLSSFLSKLQATNTDIRINGGIYEEYYKTIFGWKIRKRVNSWASFFTLQAIYWKNNIKSLSFDHEISFLF